LILIAYFERLGPKRNNIMKIIYRLGSLLLLSLLINSSFACPFIIKNDSSTAILVVDPYNKQALRITPDNEAEIDPSITGWQYYFYHEKLDIYVARQDNPNLFYRRYQLVEKYCTADKTKLALSDIAQFINKPTDRFDTFEFTAHEHSAHKH